VAHVAGSQRWWIGEILGGRNMHRDREAEFRADDLPAEALLDGLDKTMALTREVLASVTSEMLDETRNYKGQQVTVRYILARVLGHVALHVGHIQITRQLWDMQQGDAHRASSG
jgi:TolB-like protein